MSDNQELFNLWASFTIVYDSFCKFTGCGCQKLWYYVDEPNLIT